MSKKKIDKPADKSETKQRHFSISQLLTYQKCPLHYYFRYIKGKKTPPRSPMIVGSSVHSALEHNFKQKIKSHKDLKTIDLLNVYSDSFDLARPDTLWKKDEKPGKIKDDGLNLIRAYHTGKDSQGNPMFYRTLNQQTRKYEVKPVKPLSPTIQPIMVEEEFEVQFENVDYKFIGRIDLVDDKKRVRDTKTSSRTPTQDQVDQDLQMTAYSMGYRAKTGKAEKGIFMDYIVKNGTPKIMSIKTHRTIEDINRLLNLMARIAHAIDCGVFYCSCNPIYCNSNNCGYWDLGDKTGCKYGIG